MSKEKQQLPQGRGKERNGQAISSSILETLSILVPDGRPSSKTKLYDGIKTSLICCPKNSNGDVFNQLTFTEEAEKETIYIVRAPSKRQGKVPLLHVVHSYSCFESPGISSVSSLFLRGWGN